jgi:methyl-accepting chemotaxis protein
VQRTKKKGDTVTIKSKLFIYVATAVGIILILAVGSNLGTVKLGTLYGNSVSRSQEATDAVVAAHIGSSLYEVIADAIINRNLDNTDRDWAKAKEEALKAMALAVKAADTPEEKLWTSGAERAQGELIVHFESKMLPVLRSTDKVTPEIKELDSQIDKLAEAIATPLDKFRTSLNNKTKANDLTFKEVRHNISLINSIIALIGMAAMLLISRIIYLGLMKDLGGEPNHVRKIVQTVSRGDLTVQVELEERFRGSVLWEMKEMVANLRTMFQDMTNGVAALSTSATELTVISRQMTSNAELSSSRAHSVATAAEEMSASLASVAGAMDHATSNVSSVATATEEMTSTISEVARSSDKARTITGHAVTQASEITRQVVELGRAAREIGKVTETITAISAQTNLLALNATIEAARAGAAGKGFTVVASEIKELAQQTATATEGIRDKIENIQSSTRETVADIEKISTVIQEVSEMITSTAVAIEQQSVVTKDIATNIAQAAYGIHEVNDNVSQTSRVSETIAHEITEANQAAGEISSSSAQVLISSEELARLAEHLKVMSGRFRL